MERACATYYFGNLLFDHVYGEPLFRLMAKILDPLAYFGVYKFSLHTETDPVLTSLAVKRCMEVDWDKTSSKDGFVR